MISKTTTDLVKQRTDLAALIGETVKLTRRGRSFIGLCPFHKEKTPSFHVTPERGKFHCFGCGKHGGAIDFLMETEGYAFPEAVRALAERAGITIEETNTERERKEDSAARKARDDLYGAMQLGAVYYETMLREHPDASVAKDELAKRELVPKSPTDAIATALGSFRMGYAPSGWDGLATFFREQGVSPALAEQVGLLLPRKTGPGHYDRFRNRLMFAVIDMQGRVVAFSGRILPDPKTGVVDKDTGKYINSPETPIYRKGELVFGLFQARQAIRQAEEAVLVEGNFDVVSLHARGLLTAVAPLGTAFTPAQAALLKRYAPTVTLLFDGDAAGRKATRAAREPAKNAGLSVKAATLPEGVDPDDLARTRGIESVQAVIRSAKSLLEYLITTALDEGFSRADAEERVARAREVIELLASEDDPTVRAMAQKYADDIAGNLALPDARTGMVDTTTFQALTRQVQAGLNAPRPNPRAARVPDARPEPVMEAFIGCLFDFPALLEDPELAPYLVYLDGDAVFVVAALRELASTRATDLASVRATEPQSTPADMQGSHPMEGDNSEPRSPDEADFALDADAFLVKVPPSFHAFAAQRTAAPVHQDIETARSELLANAEKLKVRSLSRDNAHGAAEAARVSAMGDEDEAVALLLQVQQRAREKRGIKLRSVKRRK